VERDPSSERAQPEREGLMDAKSRALMWSELRKVNEIASTYLDLPFAEAGIRPLALGLRRVGYILETLLLEHGPEIDLLGRTIVRDVQGKVIERVERSNDAGERDEPEV
jgi:hypothetical protein